MEFDIYSALASGVLCKYVLTPCPDKIWIGVIGLLGRELRTPSGSFSFLFFLFRSTGGQSLLLRGRLVT